MRATTGDTMPKRMLRAIAPCLATAPLAAQVPTDVTVVATRLSPPAPATQLLAVDASGTVAPFGRFPNDILPPLAVEIDPIDRHVLLALDLGLGQSQIVRLIPAGAAFASEQFLALVGGPVTQLAVVGDEIFAGVGGPGGGLYVLPRRGGSPALVTPRANLDAMFVFGQQPSGILAWTGTTMPQVESGLAYTDFTTGLPYFGPFGFGSAQPAVTGVTDVPTGLPRQLLSFADGTIATFAGFLGPPQALLITPQPPAGGVVAMKSPGPSFFAVGLGGSAFPFLYDLDPNAGTITPRTAALPGDPVDFAMPAPGFAQATPFGSSCGAPAMTITDANGPPQLGNAQYRIGLGGAAPNQAALLAAGFSDTTASGAQLPFALPGGCVLHVAPDVVLFHQTTAAGAASQAMPIPNAPLAGVLVFVQWLQLAGPGFRGSGALAVQIGP